MVCSVPPYSVGSIEEAITALTLNGAAALNRADSIGSIEVGKKGAFVVLNKDNYHFLPYYVGMNCVPVSYTHLDVYKRQAWYGSYQLLVRRVPAGGTLLVHASCL